MKRKFILLPIALTTLAPAISLVGCGDPDTPEPTPPDPEDYEGVELKWNQDFYDYFTDWFHFKRDGKYHIWVDDISEDIIEDDGSIYMLFWKDGGPFLFPNMIIDNFLIDDDVNEYTTDYSSFVLQTYVDGSCDIDLYVTFNQEYYGYFRLS